MSSRVGNFDYLYVMSGKPKFWIVNDSGKGNRVECVLFWKWSAYPVSGIEESRCTRRQFLAPSDSVTPAYLDSLSHAKVGD